MLTIEEECGQHRAGRSFKEKGICTSYSVHPPREFVTVNDQRK